MAKLFGLDIPFGLENLFAAVIQQKPNGTVNGAGLTLPKQNTAKAKRTGARSLMVLWGPMFDGFTLDRRNAWHSYWGGWPGSGFSAFIEVNAPRYRNGDDLILDPPGFGDELLTNGFLESNADGWDLNVGGNAAWEYGDNNSFTYAGIDSGEMYSPCEIEDGQVYEVHIAGLFTPHNFGSVTVRLGNGPEQDLNFADSQVATILLIAGVSSDDDKYFFVRTNTTFTGGVLNADNLGLEIWSIQKYNGMSGDGDELYSGEWHVEFGNWSHDGASIVVNPFLSVPDFTKKLFAQSDLTLVIGGHYRLKFASYGIPGKYNTKFHVWCGSPSDKTNIVYTNRLNAFKQHRVDFVAHSDSLLFGFDGQEGLPGVMLLGGFSLQRSL